jgi:hypothetical protein
LKDGIPPLAAYKPFQTLVDEAARFVAAAADEASRFVYEGFATAS